jgi:hypothetical protein
VNTETKLANALRAIVGDVDKPGGTIRSVRAVSIIAAREALADFNAQQEAKREHLRALIIRDAEICERAMIAADGLPPAARYISAIAVAEEASASAFFSARQLETVK